jgi:hypothetical protein
MMSSKRKPTSRSKNVETGPFLSQLKKAAFIIMLLFLLCLTEWVYNLLTHDNLACKILVRIAEASAIWDTLRMLRK